ncbi:MAG: hypothetical protein ACREP9_14720 [Candidatus Dormibacteraceae bacterium]
MSGFLTHLHREANAALAPAKFAAACLALVFLAGCAAPQVRSDDHNTLNTFNWTPMLPADLRRVALLPITCEGKTLDDTEGRDALEPILQAELARTKRFEVVSISPEALEKQTGKPFLCDDDLLPSDLFDWLKNSCGCDAVLFCRLTSFQAYPPLTVGWRMRLVHLRSRNTLWAADQVFDAGQGTPCPQSRLPQWLGLGCPAQTTEEWLQQNSPRHFGQMALAKLFSTLPDP